MNRKTTALIAIGCLILGAFVGGGAYKTFVADPAEQDLKVEAECERCSTTLSALWRLRANDADTAIVRLEAVQDSAVARLTNLLTSTRGTAGTSRLLTNARDYRLKFPAPPRSTNVVREMRPRLGLAPSKNSQE